MNESAKNVTLDMIELDSKLRDMLVATWEVREAFPKLTDAEFAAMLAKMGVNHAIAQVDAARSYHYLTNKSAFKKP